MEDSHICNTTLGNGVSLFGVFDGHGGKLLFQNYIHICANRSRGSSLRQKVLYEDINKLAELQVKEL